MTRYYYNVSDYSLSEYSFTNPFSSDDSFSINMGVLCTIRLGLLSMETDLIRQVKN